MKHLGQVRRPAKVLSQTNVICLKDFQGQSVERTAVALRDKKNWSVECIIIDNTNKTKLLYVPWNMNNHVLHDNGIL